MQAQSKTEWATELRTAITFDEVIFLLERQKDVDALRNIKLVAACDPEGAGNERSQQKQVYQRVRRDEHFTDFHLPFVSATFARIRCVGITSASVSSGHTAAMLKTA